MPDLTEEQRVLLLAMRESQDHGAFAIACDGPDRRVVHQLERLSLAVWRGTNWGSSFWSITPAGRALSEEASHA